MAKDSRPPQQVSEDLHAQLEHLTAALRHLAGHAPRPISGQSWARLGEAGALIAAADASWRAEERAKGRPWFR